MLRWWKTRKMRWAVRYAARMSGENRILFVIARTTHRVLKDVTVVRDMQGTWQEIDVSRLHDD